MPWWVWLPALVIMVIDVWVMFRLRGQHRRFMAEYRMAMRKRHGAGTPEGRPR